MTVVAGVASVESVSIAADSLHVDLRSGLSSSVDKVRAGGGMLAALAGVSDVDGVDFFAVLDEALSVSQSIDQVPAAFVRAGGAGLVCAFDQWQVLTRGGVPVEGFVEIVAAQAHDGVPRLLHAWTVVDSDALTMRYLLYSATQEQAAVVAAGSTIIVAPLTTEAKRVRQRIQQLRRDRFGNAGGVGDVGDVCGQNTASDAARLVQASIAAQAQIPRPAWWGEVMAPNAPVIAGPVTCRTLRC